MGMLWSDEDNTMVAAILGTKAFDYLMSNSVSADCSLVAMGSDDNLQNKLSDFVERPNANNFSWNYAIFWQISRSKSGELVLGWGDGCCREARAGEETEVTRVLNLRLKDEAQQRMRKRVLQKLHVFFGGTDEFNYVFGLDRVTDIEMFFLASMYFSFPRGQGGPGKCFGADGKHVWLSDVMKSSVDYCSRSFLMKSAGMRTVVLIPTNVGVVELGSVQIIPESLGFVQLIKSLFSAQVRATHQFREKVVVRKPVDRPMEMYINGNRAPFMNAQNGVRPVSFGNVKPGNSVELCNPQAPANNLQEIVRGGREDFRLNNLPGKMQADLTNSRAVVSPVPIVESEHSVVEVSFKENEADERRPRKRGRKLGNEREEALNDMQKKN